MKALVVYESVYGNTEKVAKAIGAAVGSDVKVVRTGECNVDDLKSVDLLFIGGPTQGGRATQPVQDFLSKITESVIKDKKVAVFDTRLSTKLVGIFGYAGKRIAENLKDKGANIVLGPEGFFVAGKNPELKPGELDRAAAWAKSAVSK